MIVAIFVSHKPYFHKTFEFFRIEFVENYFLSFSFLKVLKLVFYRLYRFCRRLFLVLLIFETTKNSFLQIL